MSAEHMPPTDGTRPRRLIAEATSILIAAGVGSPRFDADLLAAYVLGVPRGRLTLVDRVTPEQETRFRDLVARRAARVPLQHLTGSAPFRELDLAVGPGVFVPRPETELLVDWALALPLGPAPVVVDLCGGSGAIALAVANERPDATVHVLERDPAALSWLRRNAADRAAAGDRPVTVVAGDVADPAALAHLAGRVDLVLSNPPYVPDRTPVAPEVADHDPALAVFAGPDGLSVIHSVIACAARLLRPGGWFGMEHDDSHGATVPALIAAADRFDTVADHPDLAGRPRYATARRSGAPRLADCTA